MSDKDSTVSEVFRRADISAIHFYSDDSHFPVSNAYEPLDPLFQLYFDNDYIALNTELENCKDLVQKMYYSNVLGKGKKYVEMQLSAIVELKPPTDYVSVLLYKRFIWTHYQKICRRNISRYQGPAQATY